MVGSNRVAQNLLSRQWCSLHLTVKEPIKKFYFFEKLGLW